MASVTVLHVAFNLESFTISNF